MKCESLRKKNIYEFFFALDIIKIKFYEFLPEVKVQKVIAYEIFFYISFFQKKHNFKISN